MAHICFVCFLKVSQMFYVCKALLNMACKYISQNSFLLDCTIHTRDVYMHFDIDSIGSYGNESTTKIFLDYVVASMHEMVMLQMLNFC
jgi:aspartyl aminopeptidase